MHRELLERWFEEVWVEGDLEAIDAMFVPDTAADGFLHEMVFDAEDMKTWVSALRMLVEAIEVTIVRVADEGEWAAALVHVRCKSRETGVPATLHGQVMFRIRGGAIVEAHNCFDMVQPLQKLGLLPPDYMESLLLGGPDDPRHLYTV